MPGSYRCSQGGKHQWVNRTTAQGVSYQVCKKCGQARPQ